MKNSTYHVFFRNLANPLRIKIISALREKENSVSKLSRELKIEQSKLSHALTSLKCCNIVKVKQRGKQRIYFLNKDTIVPMLKLIDKHAKTFCKGICSCERLK
ncbi:winged helix-turn-helix transcriptional regulator [Candidatus Pacearchaeota archaeon]|nr:winged helix-turn-helix transcriptional regulator [Candidatus Pacearchaeota archaeon]